MNRAERSRRDFLRSALKASLAFSAPYCLWPVSARATTYNLGVFWKGSRVNFRLTQAYALVAGIGGPGELRLSQGFAQVAGVGGAGDHRLSQAFVQVAALP